MNSELSIFAARLREFVGLSMDESLCSAPDPEPAWSAHADAEFNGMALVLFSLQFKYNAAYRKLCEARNLTPATVHHWKQIPAVPSAAFKELEMTCLAPAERTAVFHSSGTTEQKPGRHFHSADSLATYEASLWPWFARHVLLDVESGISKPRLLILTPPPAQVPHSSLAHMFKIVRQKAGSPESCYLGQLGPDGAWVLDLEATLGRLREVGAGSQPVVLLGTAFSFVHLVDFLAGKDLRLTLPPGSRVMETGGYKNRSRSLPKAELHALITKCLGVPSSHIVCEYGMSELSSQAYDGADRHFHFPPWARAQIISPETGQEVGEGETGLIRIFDLANAYSVMALQTEDLGVRRGDGFELIGRTQAAEPRGCSLMTA